MTTQSRAQGSGPLALRARRRLLLPGAVEAAGALAAEQVLRAALRQLVGDDVGHLRALVGRVAAVAALVRRPKAQDDARVGARQAAVVPAPGALVRGWRAAGGEPPAAAEAH